MGIGTILPLVLPLGLAVSPTPPVQSLFDKIESLEPGDVVMISFDYGPSSAPENDPMAAAVLRHCLSKELRVVAIALFPIGSLTMLNTQLGMVLEDFPGLEDGIDYVNLGYKDGGQAAMRQLGVDIHSVFPTDTGGRSLDEIPIMTEVHNFNDISLVVSLATGIIGEWWANLVNAQYGVPVGVGPTAVSAPKYYAYLKAGQMIGLIGGLKGASEYEKLLVDAYPRFTEVYNRPGTYTATKGMDAQSIVHLIIVIFIAIGNVLFFVQRRAGRAS